jgi:cysteine-rich repeat protein
MTTNHLFLCTCLATALAGCSIVVDGAIQDRDGGPMTTGPCATFPDGTRCTVEGIAEDLVCNDGLCQLSQCGDGVTYIGHEDCDDDNEISGDGCEADCTFSCEAGSAACDNGDPCDGEESCSTQHMCVSTDDAPDGTPCDAGQCMDGVCVPAGCGDGVVGADEECDTGVSPDGSCQPDCTWTCETDEDCALMDPSVCDGVDTCDVDSHLCIGGGVAVACADDGEACTLEMCDDLLGCVVDKDTNDQDGDGHYTVDCGGDDCDDTEPEVYTGHSDICGDGLDNDCNGVTDDGIPTWYVDCDGDSYAASATGAITSCVLPSDPPRDCGAGIGAWTSRDPRGEDDCSDSSSSARPDQTGWLTSPYSGPRGSSYDYDCDDVIEYQYNVIPPGAIPFCSGGREGCFGSSYVTSAPTCNGPNTLSRCALRLDGTCGWISVSVTVGCH